MRLYLACYLIMINKSTSFSVNFSLSRDLGILVNKLRSFSLFFLPLLLSSLCEFVVEFNRRLTLTTYVIMITAYIYWPLGTYFEFLLFPIALKILFFDVFTKICG